VSGDQVKGKALTGRRFQITRIVEWGENVEIVEGTAPSLQFWEQRYVAETGGNRLRGAYEIDSAGRFVPDEVIQTLRKTHGARLAQERRFKRALSGRPVIRVQDDELVLLGDDLALYGVAVPGPSPAAD
jgi:heat shock protein HslJ